MRRKGNNQTIRAYQINNERFFAVNFQFEGIRTRKRGFTSRKEAQAFVDRIRFLIVTGQYGQYAEQQEAINAVTREPTLEACVNRWAKAKTDLRDSSKERYLYQLRREIVGMPIGQLRVGCVDSAMLSKLDASIVERGSGTAYANNFIAALLKVLRYAQTLGYMNEAPKHLQWHKRRVRRSFLSYKEVMQLVRSATKLPHKSRWIGAYIMVQFYTFSRAGEVLALEWTDIDFENKRINISKRVHKGKVANTTKNDRVDCYFPLHENLIPILKKQQERTKGSKLVFPPCYFYCTDPRAESRGKQWLGHLSLPTVNYILNRLSVAAGIDPKRVSTHVLRKSAGDILLRSGATIHQVAAALRCTTANVLKSYSQLDREAFDRRIFAWSPNENDNEASSGSPLDDNRQ